MKWNREIIGPSRELNPLIREVLANPNFGPVNSGYDTLPAWWAFR